MIKRKILEEIKGKGLTTKYYMFKVFYFHQFQFIYKRKVLITEIIKSVQNLSLEFGQSIQNWLTKLLRIPHP